MTPSEKFVSQLCNQSFLPFWSFPNPIGKNNKELCDILIVCDKYVIIVSVKDITVSAHNDQEVQYERWRNKAIYDSAKQIYGAERFLDTVDEVLLSDYSTKIKLPSKQGRVYHRIAIAFGSKPDFPLPHGDFGKGFIHVFDERSTWIVFNELDTIIDFTSYLSKKEKFFKTHFVLIPTEADFLAIYLQTNLEFQNEANTIACGDDEWKMYAESEDYKIWRRDIKSSFIWDELIHTLHQHHVKKDTLPARIAQLEEAVRYINLEPRINRIELGNVLFDAISKKVSRRMLQPLPGAKHTYVFIPLTKKNWDGRESELKVCCMIARAENPEVETIIGISIGRSPEGQLLFDICFVYLPEINEEFIRRARSVQKELGYFKKPVLSHSKELR